MADTNFIDRQTVIQADWANDVNRVVYTIFDNPANEVEAAEALPLATPQNAGMMSTADRVKLDNFRIIEVEDRTANFVLEVEHAFRYFRCTDGIAISVPNLAVDIGTFFFFEQNDADAITLSPASVTINTPATLRTRAQHSVIGIVKVADGVWTAMGDLEV